MKSFASLAVLALFASASAPASASASASASAPAAIAAENNPPVFDQYEAAATELLDLSNVVSTPEEKAAMIEKSRALIVLGWDVMEIYGRAQPECATQFEEVKAQLPGSENMPLDQLRAKFHDAVGLSAAPKYCYFGRAMVYYPFVSIIKLNGEVTDKIRKQIVHHFEEAVEHLEDIRKKMK